MSLLISDADLVGKLFPCPSFSFRLRSVIDLELVFECFATSVTSSTAHPVSQHRLSPCFIHAELPTPGTARRNYLSTHPTRKSISSYYSWHDASRVLARGTFGCFENANYHLPERDLIHRNEWKVEKMNSHCFVLIMTSWILSRISRLSS